MQQDLQQYNEQNSNSKSEQVHFDYDEEEENLTPLQKSIYRITYKSVRISIRVTTIELTLTPHNVKNTQPIKIIRYNIIYPITQTPSANNSNSNQINYYNKSPSPPPTTSKNSNSECTNQHYPKYIALSSTKDSSQYSWQN